MNKFNILIAMLVCLNICGCSDFLEEDPKGKLTTDNFYNSESDARQAINGVYRRLSDSWVTGYNIKQIPNDLLKRASWDEASGLSNFTYGSENTYIAGMWQNHYAVIKDCNSVIDNVTANKEKTTTGKDMSDRHMASVLSCISTLSGGLVMCRWY